MTRDTGTCRTVQDTYRKVACGNEHPHDPHVWSEGFNVYRCSACPSCHGGGRITVGGISVNPYSGVQGRDPQEDRDERCPDCGGTGRRA